jgi:hypothetical protein
VVVVELQKVFLQRVLVDLVVVWVMVRVLEQVVLLGLQDRDILVEVDLVLFRQWVRAAVVVLLELEQMERQMQADLVEMGI